MKIYKTKNTIIIESEGKKYDAGLHDWDTFINRDNLAEYLRDRLPAAKAVTDDWFAQQTVEAPIGSQEIWAAGVTYLRSRDARMEESKDAGGGTFYDKVYDAARPEIFYKGTKHRTVGTGGKVRIRRDSTWNVPEPELTLFMSTSGSIVGYTIGNDMSSRSIEGENPLYLPQAKVYDGCAGLGPCIYVPGKPIDEKSKISLEIKRDGKPVFSNSIAITQMKRKHVELAGYLFMECSFPTGVFMMTGTGIVPPNDFTVASGDEIVITIENIGTLVNFVA
ncbi:fumarylacetoacetate hydrolase family protein [Chryseolinea sp. T2]|uniref:fumarylacetoacetate hydrolase family protein n=1 Tax=Chryseolinea sp. T2 TaxID=3129255 RepID=UPI0030772905